MTEIELSHALKDYLEKELDTIALNKPALVDSTKIGSLRTVKPLYEDKGENLAKVNVLEGFIPSKDSEASYFPYITIFLVAGTIEQDRVRCTVQLDCGVYSQEEVKHLALMNLIHRTTRALNRLKANCLAGNFILSAPIEWQLPREDHLQLNHASVITSFDMITVRPEDDDLL